MNVGIADGPLKRLLSTHRKADDCAQMLDVKFFAQQLVNDFDVVADRHGGESGAMEGFWRIAWRGGASVAEQFAGDQEQLARDRELYPDRSASRSRSYRPCSETAVERRYPRRH
jgi:hypothetical protein